MIFPLILAISTVVSTQMQDDNVLFFGTNAGEGPNLLNYLDSKGIKCYGQLSTSLRICFDGSPMERDRILKAYKDEFGVDLTKVDKNGQTIVNVPRCTLKYSPPQTVENILKTLSGTSLLAKTITECSSRFHLSLKDKVNSITYYVHPAMLNKKKRGEYLQGTIEAAGPGNSNDIPLFGTQ